MSDTQFTHTDKDGDTLTVDTGVLGAVVSVKSEAVGFEGAVAVRFVYLPSLIAALQGILDESDHDAIPAEHDEDLCSGGVTMCHECYAAGADAGDAA